MQHIYTIHSVGVLTKSLLLFAAGGSVLTYLQIHPSTILSEIRHLPITNMVFQKLILRAICYQHATTAIRGCAGIVAPQNDSVAGSAANFPARHEQSQRG